MKIFIYISITLLSFNLNFAYSQWSEPDTLFAKDEYNVFINFEDGPVNPLINVCVDNEQKIHLVFTGSKNEKSDIFYCNYTSNPLEKTNISNSERISFLPSITADNNNTIHCAWTDMNINENYTANVFYNQKTSHHQWSEVEQISDYECEGLAFAPVLKSDSKNKIHLFYNVLQFNSEEKYNYFFLTKKNEKNEHYFLKYSVLINNQWTDHSTLPNCHESQNAFRPNFIIDPTDHLHLFWYDGPPAPRRRIYHSFLNNGQWSDTTNILQGYISDDYELCIGILKTGELFAFNQDYYTDEIIYGYKSNELQNIYYSGHYGQQFQAVIDDQDKLHLISDLNGELQYCYCPDLKKNIWRNPYLISNNNAGFGELAITNDTLHCFWITNNLKIAHSSMKIYEPTDVEENTQDNSISGINLTLYPNPCTEELNIFLQILDPSNYQIEVYNILGEKVAKIFNEYIRENKKLISWNTNNLSEGTYFIKIEDKENKFSLTKQFIKLK